MGKAINELDSAGSITDATLVPVGETDTLKKTTWATVKSTLKTYFDTLYQSASANLTSWAALATSAKQDALVSGTSIKTVNSTTLLGSGDVAVQATLVSGTNIKTINSTSLLGSGDLTVSASPGGSTTQVQYNSAGAFAGASNITTNGSRLDFSANTSSQSVSSMKIAGQYGDVFVGGYAGLMILSTNNANLSAGNNCRIGPGDISLMSTGSIGFASSATGALGTGSDTALKRDSAGVMKVTDGGSNLRDLKLRNLIASGGVVTLASFTVSTLPSASTSGAGAMAYVTDSNATTYRATVAGGGSDKVTVTSDGSNWIITG